MKLQLGKAFFQLHLSIFLAGFTGVLGRFIQLNEGMLVFYRLLLSVTTMWVLFFMAGQIQKISQKDIFKIILVGFIAALHWICFYGAIKYSSVSISLICFSSVGFFSSILEPIILKRKVSVTEILLGLLVILGIFIIFKFEGIHRTGIVFGIFSAFLGAIFPIYNRQFMQRMNAPTLMTWELTGGFMLMVFLLPYYINLENGAKVFPNTKDWIGLLILSWLCSVWAFQLSSKALKSISAFTVNISFNLEPLYGIALAFFLFHENKFLGHSFFIGTSLIILSVVLQTIRTIRKA